MMYYFKRWGSAGISSFRCDDDREAYITARHDSRECGLPVLYWTDPNKRMKADAEDTFCSGCQGYLRTKHHCKKALYCSFLFRDEILMRSCMSMEEVKAFAEEIRDREMSDVIVTMDGEKIYELSHQ